MKRKEKVLMGLMAICFLAASASFAGPGIGSPAPNFTLPDSAGVNRSLTSYRGRVVMLNFWASWWGSCVAELPRLQVIRNDYVARGFEILGIDDEVWSTQLPFNRQYSWVFLRDANNAVWALYQQNGYIPLNYVIDTNGIVRYWGEGFDEAAVRAAIVAWLPVGIEAGETGKPKDGAVSLAQNRPNPAKGSTEIAFSLPKAENVRLSVYDAQGRLVKTLAEGARSAGTHHIGVSGLESGVYFYRLEAGGSALTRRMVVTR